jgi:N-acetylglucosamine-6-phosphate deacetylase
LHCIFTGTMMPELNAYTADQVFTGTEWIKNHAVLTVDGTITALCPLDNLPAGQFIHQYTGCFIAPAFIDLQIYGAANKLLAVYPDPEALAALNKYCIAGGASLCLPTVATNTYETFCKCIDAVKKYWAQGGPGVLGLHIEGPWINEIKRGAHTASLIHTPAIAQVQNLLEYGKGVIKMITLAPEICSKEIIELILSNNIIVSAGHSNATYDEAKAGFANGITTVTHLYNAMSALQHRAPGLAGATMDDKNITASIIPDGYHVDYAAIRIAKQIMKERLFVITDAVTTTTAGNYQHQLAGDKYEADGILSGSALTMNKALQNLVHYVHIDVEEALRMCSLYPAKVMGIDNRYGKIEKGYAASMVVLDKELHAVQTTH